MVQPRTMAILHGGPLDGRAIGIGGVAPENDTSPVPALFTHVGSTVIHYYFLRRDRQPPQQTSAPPAPPARPAAPSEIAGYDYDYSCSMPR